MSQSNVERIVGRLVTDEGFRRRFAADPSGLLRELTEAGFELNGCELLALSALNVQALARLAEVIDPRLHKVDLCGGWR
jgi:hypothetical protein